MWLLAGAMHHSGVHVEKTLCSPFEAEEAAPLPETGSFQEAEDKSDDSWPINSPRVLGKLALIVPLPYAWQAGAELQYTGERRTTSGKADAYTLANLTLSRSNILKGLDVSVSAYNLFDKEYEDPADTGAFVQDILKQDGRTLRLKLDYRF